MKDGMDKIFDSMSFWVVTMMVVVTAAIIVPIVQGNKAEHVSVEAGLTPNTGSNASEDLKGVAGGIVTGGTLGELKEIEAGLGVIVTKVEEGGVLKEEDKEKILEYSKTLEGYEYTDKESEKIYNNIVKLVKKLQTE